MEPRIFISAVSQELGKTRQLTANVLTRLGYDPVWQDIFGTESGDLRQMLRTQIDDCNGLIQLVGGGYGAEPPTVETEFGRVSYTQFEFLHARARCKKTWLIYTAEGCTLDHPLEELDCPRDPTHPDPVGFQAERRALQVAWRQRWQQEGHLFHEVSSDTRLELMVERLKDEFSELRHGFRSWQRRVTRILVVVVVVMLIAFGAVASIHWQQQTERDRAESERIAQQLEREMQEREREKQNEERLAAEAARQQARKVVEVEQEIADRLLNQLLTNKEISAEEARQRAIRELPPIVKLSLEEILTIIDRRIPPSTLEAPVSPLERARTALAQGKYDDVFQAADDEREEGREVAMLEGTAALARFRESPKPEWNDRAVVAFRRALASSDNDSKDWTVAAISLASALHDLARYAEAEPLLVESQRILEDKHGNDSAEVATALNNLGALLQATNRLAEAEPLIHRCVVIFQQFGRKTGHEHPGMQTVLANYREILQSMKLPDDEVAERLKDVTTTVGPLKPIVPEVERLLGPAKPVSDVLAALDRQYKADGKPAVYFLPPDQPIAPHLDELLGRFRLDVPINEPIFPHLEKLLGPAKSTREVFETLDRQYREQNKPEVWFLPLTKPIAPHLDELLGPVSVTGK